MDKSWYGLSETGSIVILFNQIKGYRYSNIQTGPCHGPPRATLTSWTKTMQTRWPTFVQGKAISRRIASKRYSMITWTRPLGNKLINQNITWAQRIAIFFSNKPITKLKTQQSAKYCKPLRKLCHLLIGQFQFF